MYGKIFVTSTGYDPEKGKHVKDPYPGPNPTLGACRPDIREKLQKGDHIFVVSGSIKGHNQYVIGGFEIKEKISPIEAYDRFPEHRLSRLSDGQVTGNIIVNAKGKQHELDHHDLFERRIKNYIVGMDPIILSTPTEIAECRYRTLEILREIFNKKGDSVRSIIGRCSNLNEMQVEKLREWLNTLKDPVAKTRPVKRIEPAVPV